MKRPNVRQAMILAAGYGTRLPQWTQTHPKALAPVGGRPHLRNVLGWLSEAGVTEVVINLHHFGAQIRKYLATQRMPRLEIRYSEEPEILGTGGGIVHARPLLRDEPFFVYNCDVASDVDLREVGALHVRLEAVATMVLRPDAAAKDYGAFSASGGRVSRMLGRGEGDGPDDLMFTGIHCLGPDIFRWLKADRFSSIVDELYLPAFAAGETVAAHVHRGYWADTGTRERLEQVNMDIVCGRLSLPSD